MTTALEMLKLALANAQKRLAEFDAMIDKANNGAAMTQQQLNLRLQICRLIAEIERQIKAEKLSLN